MAKLGINTGSAPDAGDGDSLQQGAIKINSNFDEVYTLLGDGSALAPGIVTSIVGGNNVQVSSSTGQVTIDVSGSTWGENSTGIHTLSNVGIGTTNATDELKVSGTVKTDQLVVVGVSTFSNDVNFEYDLVIGEDAALERNLKVTGVSTFVGESNFDDSVLIAGITTCSNDLDVSNDIVVGGGVSVADVSTFADGIRIGSQSQTILPSGSNDLEIRNAYTGGEVVLRAAGNVKINSYQGSTLLKTDTGAVTQGGLSLYYATGLGAESKKLETTNSGVTVTGEVNATSFVGDGSGLTGVNATGTGVSVSDGGSFIGVASAINFGNNLSVSPISAGIVTITGQAGGGSTADVRTNTLNVSGMTTFAMGYYGSGSEVRFLSEESPGGSLSISHAATNPYGVYMRFASHDGDDATIETDSNANMTIDAGANIHLKTNNTSILSGSETGSTALYYGGAQKLATLSSGITITGDVSATGDLSVSDVSATGGLSVSGVSTTGTINVGHDPNTQGSGSIIKANELNLTGPNSTDINSTYYSNIRLNRIGGNFRYDLEFHSNGYSSGDIGDFIFYRRGTSYQRYERMRLSGETGKLTVTGSASVGAGSSVNGVDSPALTLSHNNPIITGTAGTTGEIKQIGGTPFYYDGSSWREFVLSSGTPVSVPADTEWDNVIYRNTFDSNFVDAKFNQNGIVGGGITVTGSPVKIGSGALRIDGSSQCGVEYPNRSEYSFTGSWTIEGWIYFDGRPAASRYYSLVSMFGVGAYEWSFGYYTTSVTNVVFNFSNENSTSGVNVGIVLNTDRAANWDYQWNHIALVREGGSGRFHFYINGVEHEYTADNIVIDNNIVDNSGNSLTIGANPQATNGVSVINNISWNNGYSADIYLDDLRISAGVGTAGQRYTSIGSTTAQVFTPSTVALPTTGTLSSTTNPPGDKYGEIVLGGTPSWVGTSGVTVSQQSSGNYRLTFTTSYTDEDDYFVLSQAMDQGFASYVGVARSTDHVDFSVNRQSNDAAVDTGSLSVQIKNHI